MKIDNTGPVVAFIGCGNMGEALLRGILEGGFTTKDRIKVSTATRENREALAERYGIIASADNAACAQEADLVILAVKPIFYERVITEFKLGLKENAMVLSIAPPYTLQRLRSLVERDDVTVARSMPNLGASIGLGVTAVVDDPLLTDRDRELLKSFAESFGEAVFLREDQMAGISSLIGSSPAYLAMVLEALAEGAIELGIPATQAHTLAAKAMQATASLILQNGDHPAVLRDRVCSAGGTSITGVARLEHGFKGSLIDAMISSAERFEQLEDEASAEPQTMSEVSIENKES